MAWTDQMVEDLRRMWKEGMTTGAIGKKLGVSKNSIIGKVHRLGLSGRPSPIKRKSDTSAPKPSLTNSTPNEVSTKNSTTSNEKTASVKPVEQVSVPPQKIIPDEEKFISTKIESKPIVRKDGKVMLTNLGNHTCRWPIGDPKDENFHFCGKRVKLGQTYCEEHAALAYVKPNLKK